IVSRAAGRAAAVSPDGLVAGKDTILDGERTTTRVPDATAVAASSGLKGEMAIDDSAVAADGLVAHQHTLAQRTSRARSITEAAAGAFPAAVAADGLVAEEVPVADPGRRP